MACTPGLPYAFFNSAGAESAFAQRSLAVENSSGNPLFTCDPSGNCAATGALAANGSGVGISTAGYGLAVAEGSTAKQRTATLSGGAAVVSKHVSHGELPHPAHRPESWHRHHLAGARGHRPHGRDEFHHHERVLSDSSVVAYEIFEPG
jgi:hypothetical protein